MFNKFNVTCVSVTFAWLVVAVIGGSLISHSDLYAQGKGGGKGGNEAVYSVTELPGISSAFGDPDDISDPDADGHIYIVGQNNQHTIWKADTDGQVLGSASLPFNPHGVNCDGVVAGTWSGSIAAVWQEGNFYWGLPLIVGGDSNEAWGINDNWEVVGQEFGTDPVTGDPFSRGVYFRLNPDGTIAEARSLGTFLPVKISNTGLAAGRVEPFPAMADLNVDPPAVTLLDSFPTATLGYAYDVNNFGEVTGSETYEINRRGDIQRRAFHWSTATGIMDLGTFAKHSWSEGWSINDAGQIVGVAPDKHDRLAFLWDGSEMHKLSDLVPGSANISRLRGAFGINSAGQIICKGLYEGQNGYKVFLLTPLP